MCMLLIVVNSFDNSYSYNHAVVIKKYIECNIFHLSFVILNLKLLYLVSNYFLCL